MDVGILQSAIDIMTPVLEGSMIAAAHYAKACNRDTVTSVDMKYGMRYCAQHCVGKHIGTLFPELDSDDDDASSIEEVDEDDEPFTRYSGDDEIMNTMNTSYDNWDQWVPESIVEIMLKDAIDKNN